MASRFQSLSMFVVKQVVSTSTKSLTATTRLLKANLSVGRLQTYYPRCDCLGDENQAIQAVNCRSSLQGKVERRSLHQWRTCERYRIGRARRIRTNRDCARWGSPGCDCRKRDATKHCRLRCLRRADKNLSLLCSSAIELVSKHNRPVPLHVPKYWVYRNDVANLTHVKNSPRRSCRLQK